jgi:hypothetical protein
MAKVKAQPVKVEKRPAPVEAATVQMPVKVCPRCTIPPKVYATARRGAFVRKYAICPHCGRQIKWDEKI